MAREENSMILDILRKNIGNISAHTVTALNRVKDYTPQLVKFIVELAEMDIGPYNRFQLSFNNPQCSVTRYEIMVLLAKEFLCHPDPKYRLGLDFQKKLYQAENAPNWCNPVETIETKMICFAHYFDKCMMNSIMHPDWLKEKVTFTRNIYNGNAILTGLVFPGSNIKFPKVTMREGSITDNIATVADFANKDVGGGTIGFGLAQEEIMMLNSPELLMARILFRQSMRDNEAISVKGYFIVNQIDFKTKRHFAIWVSDPDRNEREMVAFDASDYRPNRGNANENDPVNFLRDIVKAYVAMEDAQTFCTGNWGCGVFKGNVNMSFAKQYIAATFANVTELKYYHFNAQERKKYIDVKRLIKSKIHENWVRWNGNINNITRDDAEVIIDIIKSVC